MRRSQYYPVAGAVLASILASCADTSESRPLDGADTQHADGSILDADVSGSEVDTTDDDPSGQDAANEESDTETGTETDAAVSDTLTDTDTSESDTAEPDTTPDDADSDTQTDSGDIEQPNEAPTIVVAAPEDGAVIAEGRPLVFRARVQDDLDSHDNMTIVVSSSLQGVLFEGSPRSDGSVLVTVAEPIAGSHTLRVVATDTGAAGSEANIVVSVLSALAVPRVHITPGDPGDDDDLSATLDFPADPDALGYTLAWDWRVDGEDAAQDRPAVDAEQTEPGQVWMVRATLTDSLNRSSAATATVTIQEPHPLVDAVALVPDAPVRATMLRCDAILDDSASGAEFRWWAIASGRSDQRLTGTQAERDAVDLLPGQRVVCEVVPLGDTVIGTPLRSNEDVIANQVPVPGTVSVEPATPEPGDSLRCVSQGVSDADGDALSSAWTWTINGDVVEGADTAILSQPLSVGDEISCALTVADQWDYATAEAAPPVVVIAAGETEPTVQVVAIGSCNVLTCELTGYDANAGNFTWTINGESIEESSQTLGSQTPVDGDLITCGFISPDTSGIASEPFTYRQLRPAIDGVTTTTSVRLGDSVECSPVIPEGHCSGAWEYEYAWTVNGRGQAMGI